MPSVIPLAILAEKMTLSFGESGYTGPPMTVRLVLSDINARKENFRAGGPSQCSRAVKERSWNSKPLVGGSRWRLRRRPISSYGELSLMRKMGTALVCCCG